MSPPGTVPTPLEGSRHFTFTMNDGLCAEAKIYEYLANKLPNNVVARLRIWSERTECRSCLEMKSQFMKEHPSVELEVYGMEREVVMP